MACTKTGVGDASRTPVSLSEDSIRQETESEPATRRDTLVVAMTGDIMMGTTYPDTALPVNDGRTLFEDVRLILERADIAVGNLEGTLCDSAETKKKESEHSYSFRTPTRFAQRLAEAGYDFLSMANNHSYDFGFTGVRSTELALEARGIGYAGIKGRARYAVTERDGVRYGFCAFGHNKYTYRHQDLNGVREILDSLGKRADIVIVSFHGGAEGVGASHLPDDKEEFLGEDRGSLRAFARFCVDNGADIVYGHGPHVPRCVEVYKGRFIAYSLGNFCTPYGISIVGIAGQAPIIEAKIDREGRFLSGQIHSFTQKKGLGPRRDSTRAAAELIKALTESDMPGGAARIRRDGRITIKDAR